MANLFYSKRKVVEKLHRFGRHQTNIGPRVFLERTRILSGIQFTMHFIEFFVVETKRFVGSFVNVILTRQTCGQRSSRAAESKRRALGNYLSELICYMFLLSKCRRLRSRSVHNFGTCVWRTAAQWRKKTCFDAGKIGIWHCDAENQRSFEKYPTPCCFTLEKFPPPPPKPPPVDAFFLNMIRKKFVSIIFSCFTSNAPPCLFMSSLQLQSSCAL